MSPRGRKLNVGDTVSMYHAGSRSLQNEFDTRRLADRLQQRLSLVAFTPEDTAFIASPAIFMLATAGAIAWRTRNTLLTIVAGMLALHSFGYLVQ